MFILASKYGKIKCSMDIRTIDVIIPTYKPGKKLLRLLRMLEKQTVCVHKILLVNTEEKYYEKFLSTFAQETLPSCLEVHHISKEEFDHGGTRRWAVSLSAADAFLCMTDDAVPKDIHLVEHLVSALQGEKVAVAYGRQLASPKADQAEVYTRAFNYPAKSMEKSQEDIPRLGIKTYFCSNVCAMYNRKIYDAVGGFVPRTIFNEDMIFAGTALQKGYRSVYAAEAQVYHAHRYTGRQQFHRNFDLGVSQAEHPEIFAGLPSEGEGMRLVKDTTKFLWTHHLKYKIPGLYVTSFCKYAGYFLGKRYASLPKRLVEMCTTNPGYFRGC